MEYAALADIYRRLEATPADLEKTAIVAETLAAAPRPPEAAEDHLPLLATLVRGNAFADWEGDELGVSSSLTRQAVVKATGVDADELDAQYRERGDLGDAAAWAVENRVQRTLVSETLTVAGVVETLRSLPGFEGEGSRDRRVDAVADLVADADPDEARYVVRTVVGAMRLGVGEGTVRDAVAQAFLAGAEDADSDDETAVAAVERAHQVTNDFRVVATTARDEGLDGLRGLDVELFRPIKVMLAGKAEGLASGLVEVVGGDDPEGGEVDGHGGDEGDGGDESNGAGDRDDVLVEYKYDGIRAQLHKDGEEVRVFTRRLDDVTEAFPDLVRAVREGVDVETCILEAEVVGYDPDTGRSVPFQRLSRRVKRTEGVEAMAEEIPVVAYLFDAVYVDGDTLLDTPLRERLDRLDGAFEATDLDVEAAERVHGPSDEAAAELYEAALADGHEGVVLKNLAATYQPGSRVGYMMKVKPTMEPLDLVVVGAEWSQGRKSDWLGRLHLACTADSADPRESTDSTGSGFVKVGRMFSGLTDEQLVEMTERLEPLVVEDRGNEVVVRPKVVVEVEYEEIQSSPRYESGFALRFPRFLGFRDDLGPADADALSKVEELYEGQ
ncbi:ATP-dependent DNA ligase [Halobium salinum]|uniref:DNA ligase n=1 Tax=Halobium salinum TaxID=1364940 RepID=A0ABD5PD69_9EURY|nr:ATP-dependent DNA ligase [Halobium salinum]